MSSKLDKPLDDIVSAKRQSARNRRSSQRRSTGPKVAAPVGGIQKASKPARGSAAKPAPAKAAAAHGESKVIVSNLVRALLKKRRFYNISLTVFSAQGRLGAADQGMFPLKA